MQAALTCPDTQTRQPALPAGLLRLLSAVDWPDVKHAFELAHSLGDDVAAALADGVCLADDGTLHISPAWARRTGVRIANRPNAALAALGLHPAQPLQHVQRMDLHLLDGLSDLEPLAQASALRELRISCCNDLCNVSPLVGLAQLEQLAITRCGRLDDLPAISSGSSLRSLTLRNWEGASLQALAHATQLQTLKLNGCPGLHDLSAVAGMRQLRRLVLWDCESLTSLAALQGLPQLQEVWIDGVDGALDCTPLASLPALQSLALTDLRQPVDLTPLRGHGSLQTLDLSGRRMPQALDVLADMPALHQISLPSMQVSVPGLDEDLQFTTLLNEWLARPTEAHLHQDADARAVGLAAAVIETFRNPTLSTQWELAKPIWQRALADNHTPLSRALRRRVASRSPTRGQPDRTAIDALCMAFGRPAWMAEAQSLLALHRQDATTQGPP